MRTNRSHYITTLLLPCLGFSALTGVATACLVFVFKWLASIATRAGEAVYARALMLPLYISLLLVAAVALVGLMSALILKFAPDCKGGGIPTVVAALRGIVPFRWLRSALLVPLSALLTFICGVPLGNEGPCVQIGAALGEGSVALGGKKFKAWRRYIMTGGACAGFAVATGAPIAGILFAIEEAHRRLSPMIFMSASISVAAGQATMLGLCALTGQSNAMFHVEILNTLPLNSLWAAVPIGIVCGIVAIFFTGSYVACGKFLKNKLAKVPFVIKVVSVFALTAAFALINAQFIGSGHTLIESLLRASDLWYLLIIGLLIRAFLLIAANNVGITGGLFIPTLTFGAIIGSLCASVLVRAGLIAQENYAVLVVVGMAAFLGAASRIPVTACVFALEVLCGADNIFPVAIGVTVALLIIEVVGMPAFGDAVIDAKAEARHEGKTSHIFDVYLTVQEGAFVEEKEIRDIIWPHTCTVLSIDKTKSAHGGVGLSAGDVLHVHYQSYEPRVTLEELEALVGRQSDDVRIRVYNADETHSVPENI